MGAKGRTPLPARVEPRIPVIAKSMVAAFLDEIPVYRHLPQEQLEGEITDICVANLRLFFRCISEGRVPTADELAAAKASAARRAEERVPIDAVLSAYHIGGRFGWRALADEAEPDEHDELVEFGDAVLAFLATLTGVVASAYLEEQQLIYSEDRDARRAFADALLATGDEAPSTDRLAEAAERAGMALAPAYAVAAVRLGPSPDERAQDVSAAVAGRRKVRRLANRLEQVADGPVLNLLDPGGGLLVAPVAPERADEVLAEAPETIERLCAAADADVLAGLAWRPGAARVAEAADEAREVLRLAGHLGATRGAFRLEDVLLEHVLTTPSGSSLRLARVLAPLEAKPDLLSTLEQWFTADFDRRAAAEALHVHPNTLDYRLRRVAELTGFDPSTARGLQVLGAALTARGFATGD